MGGGGQLVLGPHVWGGGGGGGQLVHMSGGGGGGQLVLGPHVRGDFWSRGTCGPPTTGPQGNIIAARKFD